VLKVVVESFSSSSSPTKEERGISTLRTMMMMTKKDVISRSKTLHLESMRSLVEIFVVDKWIS